MATILKVHGTFASGPEEGDKWWQRGSECCNHVGELVEAEDGNLKIEQVIWDGLNSERSRQAAAAKLLDRMSELEKAGEPYCVVGHSHGGSVISAALLRASYYKQPLEKLSRWITIGTPFIEAKRSWMLFSRLGPVGKTIFLSIVALFGGILSLGYVSATVNAAAEGTSARGTIIGLVIVMFALLLIGYPFLWLLARNRLYWHNERLQAGTRQAFGDRWLSLRHADDEAVQGLSAFQTFKHPIFPRNFAEAALAKLNILVVPLLIFGAIYWVATSSIKSPTQGQNATTSAQTTPASPSAATSTARQAPPAAKTDGESKSTAAESSEKMTVVEIVLVLVVLGIFIGIPVFMYHLVRIAARPTSRALSYSLNLLTWSQLRGASLGSDVDGEAARYARSFPVWLKSDRSPLPQMLASEIASVSDMAAASSIAKLRAALSDLGFYRIEHGGRDALNAFLTGDELIHTTYFKVPRFRKLLAYSIAKSPGFRPSPALLADQDFPLIEQWYKELMAPSDPVASQNQPASLGAAAVMPT